MTKKRLEELVNLKDNWDGYGSKSVKPENAKFALEILEQVYEPSFPKPQICPGSNGELSIEWFTDVGEIQLYITAPGKSWFWRNGGDDDDGTDLANDFTQVKEQLRYLTSKK